MQPTKELIDEIYRDKVIQARKMSLEQKLWAGPELFEWSCQWALAGIRHQFPEANDERARQILQERLALQNRLEGRDDGR